MYHRHFKKFRGRPVHILEIGVYSGGSLEMWREYFGQDCRVYGVDIEASCLKYEDARTRIFIGNQGDRTFWKHFREHVPDLDIVIDDAGHKPHEQVVSFEELWPHIRRGGVYLCEDLHGTANAFLDRVRELETALHHCDVIIQSDDPERRIVVPATGLQSTVHSVHTYPFMIVIEKREAPLTEFVSPKRGTQWEPFLS